jgi:threonine dehydrogenase-like Zn-dependent dehydrogenase
VRVCNRLAGICASDLHVLYVEVDPRVSLAALPGTERVYLGHEVVGEVVEVGPGVTTLRVGDRVTRDALGATCLSQEIEPPCRFCQEGRYELCENASLGRGPEGVGGGWGDSFIGHETVFYRPPDELDDESAVLLEPLSVGVRSALRRLPRPGEKALVVGCGIVGLAVVGTLRALAPGCHVTAMARYPQQIAMAEKLGADEIVPRGDPYAAVARITGAKRYAGMFRNRALLGGYDVIYDCVGSPRTVQDSLRWARAGGTVVLVGVRVEPMRVDLTPVWHQEVDLIGMYGRGREAWNGVARSTYERTADLLLEGALPAEGWITHRFPLAQWRAAVRTAADKRSGAIKVSLTMP